jgi:hypothetical protein
MGCVSAFFHVFACPGARQRLVFRWTKPLTTSILLAASIFFRAALYAQPTSQGDRATGFAQM